MVRCPRNFRIRLSASPITVERICPTCIGFATFGELFLSLVAGSLLEDHDVTRIYPLAFLPWAVGILGALYRRAATGEGHRLQVAMQDAMLHYMRTNFSTQARTGRAVERDGAHSGGGSNAPINPLDGRDFPEHALYNGEPWFLPMIGAWYRTRDWIDRRLAA